MPSIHKTLVEKRLAHPMIKAMTEKARSHADKTVVGIDGQHSTLLSVLYQTRHGDRKEDADLPHTPGLHVQLSVQTQDTVLLVKPYPSEGHQIGALREAVGRSGAAEVKLVLSDNPCALESSQLRRASPA